MPIQRVSNFERRKGADETTKTAGASVRECFPTGLQGTPNQRALGNRYNGYPCARKWIRGLKAKVNNMLGMIFLSRTMGKELGGE